MGKELRITTTYKNFDDEWLEWYLHRLANEDVMPGSTDIVKDIKESNFAMFASKDPESSTVGVTTYTIYEVK